MHSDCCATLTTIQLQNGFITPATHELAVPSAPPAPPAHGKSKLSLTLESIPYKDREVLLSAEIIGNVPLAERHTGFHSFGKFHKQCRI